MRLYRKDNDWWYIQFDYHPALVKEVKSFSGAGYNPENKEWHIPFSLEKVAPLNRWLKENNFTEGYHYEPSKRVIEYLEPEEVITLEDVINACNDLNLVRTPRNYQAVGVAYMINHGNCVNGDDCGLGKTTQAIITAELLDSFPLLIMCPASVKSQWKKEYNKVNPDRTVGVVERKGRTKEEIWDNDVIIINYDLLWERNSKKLTVRFPQLAKRHWQAAVLDEIHFLKSGKAIRTKMAKKITKRIPNVWGLTGTLSENKPADLIEPYRIIRRFDEIFGNTKEFRYRYCNAKMTDWGMDYNGFSNLEELHELLRMAGYIRRNKRDVLDELPPLFEQVIDIPITNLKDYRRAESNLLDYLETIDLKRANSAVNAPHLVMISTLKKLSIEGKIKAITEYIKDWLEANEGEQLLVFGVHREPLQQLASTFKSPLIQGGTSSSQKYEIVQQFSKKEHRLLFANIQSAGTGTDGLQDNCSNLIHIELPDRKSVV